jgi:hypothetical protein
MASAGTYYTQYIAEADLGLSGQGVKSHEDMLRFSPRSHKGCGGSDLRRATLFGLLLVQPAFEVTPLEILDLLPPVAASSAVLP